MKRELEQIIQVLHQLNPIMEQKFHVRSIEIFGSYSVRKQTQKSDLDLLVTFSRTPTLLQFLELENFLTDQIGVKVDLVMKNSIKPRLKNSIVQNTVGI